MAFIETVLGKIDPPNIGKTDAHDHLIRMGGVEVITNGSDFDMPNENKALEELELFKQVGGNPRRNDPHRQWAQYRKPA